MKTIFWKRFKKNHLAVLGGIIVFFLFLIAILAPVVSPHDPNSIDVKNILEPPSIKHPFGTDDLGRDILSRIIWGSRISLAVGFVAVGIATVIGIILGAVSGYYGSWIDSVIMRFVDIMLSIPTFFLLLAVIAFLEPSIWNIMIVIGLTSWMGVARLVRAEFLSVETRTGAIELGSIWLNIIRISFAPTVLAASTNSRSLTERNSALTSLATPIHEVSPITIIMFQILGSRKAIR